MRIRDRTWSLTRTPTIADHSPIFFTSPDDVSRASTDGLPRYCRSPLLESLAVIAAANDRSLVEELNRAVETYVLREYAALTRDAVLDGASVTGADPS